MARKSIDDQRLALIMNMDYPDFESSMDNDPQFKQAVEQGRMDLVIMAEKNLLKQVDEGDIKASNKLLKIFDDRYKSSFELESDAKARELENDKTNVVSVDINALIQSAFANAQPTPQPRDVETIPPEQIDNK